MAAGLRPASQQACHAAGLPHITGCNVLLRSALMHCKAKPQSTSQQQKICLPHNACTLSMSSSASMWTPACLTTSCCRQRRHFALQYCCHVLLQPGEQLHAADCRLAKADALSSQQLHSGLFHQLVDWRLPCSDMAVRWQHSRDPILIPAVTSNAAAVV